MNYADGSVLATIAATFSEKIFTYRNGPWGMLKDRGIHENAVRCGLTKGTGLNDLFDDDEIGRCLQ